MPGVGYCSGKQWLFTLTIYISKATLIKLINLIQIILKLVLRLLLQAIGFKNLVTVSHSIGGKIKTNLQSLLHVFPRLAPATFIWFKF